MNVVLVLGRVLLAGVFLVAGLAKLVDRAGSRQALRDFGVPLLVARPLGVVLPLAELAVAGALLLPLSAWWGALGALTLLLIFVTGIGYNLARGRTPDCHCFGQLHSAPAGWPTLTRTVVLAALAGLVVWQGPAQSSATVVGWLGSLTTSQVLSLAAGLLLLGLLVGEGWLLLNLLHQNGRLLLRIEALEGALIDTSMAVVPPPAPSSVPALSVASAAPSASVPVSIAPAAAPATAPLPAPPVGVQEPIELTIGMATYNDFDGVYFTLQALRLYQDLAHTELLVIDNYGCPATKNLVEGWVKGRYILATDVTGTAAPRNLVFTEARGTAVVCCDCHVLFAPGAIAQLKQFYRTHPDCQDLLQGPLVYDDGTLVATHFEPRWREQMWGVWASDPRGQDPSGEPFEIPMQGLGVFSCRKDAWLGFHPGFRGFGGEEGYIHEKFRQAGRRCLCLPWLRWMHRFSRPAGVVYPLTVEDKLRNYVLGHAELGLDLGPVLQHFSHYLPPARVRAITDQALGEQWAGAAGIGVGEGRGNEQGRLA